MEAIADWSEAGIMEATRLLGLQGSALQALLDSAALLRESEAVRGRLDEALEQLPADPTDAEGFAAATSRLPAYVERHAGELREALGRHADMFQVFLIIGMLPWTTAYYRIRRIPEPILRDTMGDLAIWMNVHYAERGEWGLGNLGWLLHHVSGRLFRLGRLQFMLDTFKHPVIGLVHRQSREVAVLSEAGVAYRRDGLVDGTNSRFDQESSWQAVFERTSEAYVGHPILASGTAARQTVRLLASEWRVELHRGDPVLDMHIPEGEPMRPESCLESFARAVRFYGEHFPDRPFRALTCTSWLLDPQLAQILPASSNIAAFQSELRLFPVRSNEEETYRRVFGVSKIDPPTASRDTTLRRAIADFAIAGGLLHAAGGFRLPDR